MVFFFFFFFFFQWACDYITVHLNTHVLSLTACSTFFRSEQFVLSLGRRNVTPWRRIVSAFGRNDFVAPAALHVFSNFSFYWFDTCRRHPSFSKKNPVSASGFFAGRRGWGVVFLARAFRSEKHKVRHALKKVSPLSELHIHVAQMWTKLRWSTLEQSPLWSGFVLCDTSLFRFTLQKYLGHPVRRP